MRQTAPATLLRQVQNQPVIPYLALRQVYCLSTESHRINAANGSKYDPQGWLCGQLQGIAG